MIRRCRGGFCETWTIGPALTALHKAQTPEAPENIGAGEGNRTLVFSLEGCCSTIELHPRAGDDLSRHADGLNRQFRSCHLQKSWLRPLREGQSPPLSTPLTPTFGLNRCRFGAYIGSSINKERR